jgi:hypothetical protein
MKSYNDITYLSLVNELYHIRLDCVFILNVLLQVLNIILKNQFREFVTRILVLDDDNDNLNLFTIVLEHGFKSQFLQ